MTRVHVKHGIVLRYSLCGQGRPRLALRAVIFPFPRLGFLRDFLNSDQGSVPRIFK